MASNACFLRGYELPDLQAFGWLQVRSRGSQQRVRYVLQFFCESKLTCAEARMSETSPLDGAAATTSKRTIRKLKRSSWKQGSVNQPQMPCCPLLGDTGPCELV